MTDSLRFDASEIHTFAATMARAPELMQRELLVAGNETLDQGIELAQGFAPVRDGDLRASIDVIEPATMVGSVFRAAYGSDLVYAWQREKGGTIYPKRGRFLVFEINGRKVFARKVTQKGSHYMERSRRALQPRIRRNFEAAIARVIARLMARGG